MKTFLVYTGLDTISPEWMFVGAVLFFVLGCLEILAMLLENLPNVILAMAHERPVTRQRWTRRLISLAILPAAVLAAYSLF